MLNQESQEFASQLSSPDDFSLKEMCQLGAVASKTKRRAVSKKGWLDNLFSFGERAIGGVSKIAGKASRLSAKYGGPVPLDKEIARLSEMKQELRARISEGNGLLSGAVPRFLQARTSSSDLAASQVGSAARQTISEANAVLKTIDAAQASAQAARRQILNGVSPAKALAVFAVKMAQADGQYSHAKLRAMNMRESYQKALAETLVKPSKVSAGAYARAAGGSLIEFGRQAGRAAESAGEIVKTTGQGIKDATPLFRYLPYIAVAAAAAYAYQFLPKASASKE